MSPPSRSHLLGMLAEFSRAAAAAHRYEDLRYRSADGKIAPADIARRVFEEFYSFEEAVESHRAGRLRSESAAGTLRPGGQRAPVPGRYMRPASL